MTASKKPPVRIENVRSFWDANPLCASCIPHPLGTKEYFEYYNKLREANESIEFSYQLHEYKRFCGGRVLDVGCGNGYVLSKYAREGAEVYGVDITPAAIDLCRRRFAMLGLDGDFREANAEELPFADGYFDCVCSMGVLHHTPNPERAVDEIFRVLRPGGRLIVMFYHRNSVLYRLTLPWRSLRTGKSVAQLVDEVDGEGNPKGDVYSRAELRLLTHRFSDLDMFVGLLQRDQLPGRIQRIVPNALLKLCEKRWGWFLYAKAVRPADFAG